MLSGPCSWSVRRDAEAYDDSGSVYGPRGVSGGGALLVS